MKYETIIEKRAKKFIEAQDQNQRIRILKAIAKLPISGDIKVIKGTTGYYRLRVGDYRIIYTTALKADDGNDEVKKEEITIVTVTDAGNRGQIYK